MISKELDPFHSEEKRAKAGHAAEKQMAFLLKRFFEDAPDILVLNGVRLECDQDAAQVDHLVIHPYGLMLIESKSVAGKVQIKDDGQWIRWFDNQSSGMDSPITQAEMQKIFLRKELVKASSNKELFKDLPMDLLVAISSSGVILWPSSGPISCVCKADQVPEKLNELIRQKSTQGHPIKLTAEGREKIAKFFIKMHKPRVASNKADTVTSEPAVITPVEAPPATPVVSPVVASPVAVYSAKQVCKHCGSQHLEIRYRYNYYFACLDCEKSTPIDPRCPACGIAAKLRKQKKEFFTDCQEGCKASTLFYVNA